MFLELSRATVLLKDAATKSTIEKYDFKTQPVTKANCQIQEKNQWDDFNTNIYPTLLANANKNCKAQRYCLVIYCNALPVSAFMLLIKPKKRCPVEEITYDNPN